MVAVTSFHSILAYRPVSPKLQVKTDYSFDLMELVLFFSLKEKSYMTF